MSRISLEAPRGVIFDLGGTLVEWTDWVEANGTKWAAAYDRLRSGTSALPPRDAWVAAMRGAEDRHWRRVDKEHWSGPPDGLVRDGYGAMAVAADDRLVLATMDAYGAAVNGWATMVEGAPGVLRLLRERGYRIGLLSNTWWASAWHDVDLAAHGMAGLIDELVYTSDLPHSKPHPAVFAEVAARLGLPAGKCVMIGDRPVDDISGALGAGMRAVWRRNRSPWPSWDGQPSAIIDRLAEIPELLRGWGGR